MPTRTPKSINFRFKGSPFFRGSLQAPGSDGVLYHRSGFAHRSTPSRARARMWFQAVAGCNWLYTAAHKTRQVIIGGIFRTAVPYWPRVRRVRLPVDGSPAAFIAFGKGFFPFFCRGLDNDRHRLFRPEKPPVLDFVRKKR